MEQSSTSQQEIPKHKNALEEKYQKTTKRKKVN
jgi:hypothetical protein